MTTSSGKPPFDEKAPDPSWGAGGDSQADGADNSSGDPPTQRQPSVPVESPSEDEPPIYGAGVPYGGDDRTEEIDPIALDMPFNLDERRTPLAPAAAATSPAPTAAGTSAGTLTPRAPSATPLRNFEMDAPVKQLMLSDLFDSTPSSNLGPPDPAAFTSDRPLPREWSREPAPAPREAVVAPPTREAVVALPSIDIGSAPAASRLEQVPAGRAPIPSGHPVRANMPTPVQVQVPEPPTPREAFAPAFLRGDAAPAERGAVSLATSGAAEGPAVLRSAAEDEDEPRQRRSSPTLESIGSADARTPSSPGVAAKASSPGAAREFAADRIASSPGHGTPTLDSEPPPSDIPRFPSEVPTSRPPDVVLYPGFSPSTEQAHPGPLDAGQANLPQANLAQANAAQADVRPFDAGQPNPGAIKPAPIHSEPLNSGHANPGASSSVSSLSSGFSVRPEPRGSRAIQPARATVTAPVTSQAGKAQSNLPSIMLAEDVEAEPDSSARRAMRASRATVRLELPPGFGRPGSPTGGPSAPPASSFRPAAPAYPGVGAAIEPRVSWLANPRTWRWLAAVATLLLIVGLVIALSPRTGSLVVTALAPGNRAVDDVSIFIDGKPLCDVSPCRIKGLSPGVHTLRASAPNLASQAEETVEISAGDEATYNIDLLAVAPELRGGGLRITAGEVPLTLFVDGKRVGKLPQEVSGLSSGKHWIKLDPEDGTPPIEKSVNVLAGELVEVEPRAARRDKALVTIRLSRGSEGALVTFDDAFLLDFPAELELDPNTVHSLTATKPGFEDLSMEVKLDANETEKLIELSLSPAEGSAQARKARAKLARKPAAKAAAPTAPASTALADATQGLLNISSVPPSQIILNGRPLGSTPKTGITVPGDSLQTIVFVHPKMGRRRAQKFVPAGKERTVSIRF